MSVRIVKINPNLKIEPPPVPRVNARPQQGNEIFSAPNPTVTMYGKKRSGKTVAIYNILARCCTPQDRVVIISQTAALDSSWKAIIEMLTKRSISHVIFEDVAGKSRLGIPYNNINQLINLLMAKKEADGELTFRTFVVLDDQTKRQMNNPAVENLAKTGRHFLITLILSTQNAFDIPPGVRMNMEYILLFGKMPKDKIIKLHSDWDLTVPLKQFLTLYEQATAPEHSFLYIQRVPEEAYRRNFDAFLSIAPERKNALENKDEEESDTQATNDVRREASSSDGEGIPQKYRSSRRRRNKKGRSGDRSSSP